MTVNPRHALIRWVALPATCVVLAGCGPRQTQPTAGADPAPSRSQPSANPSEKPDLDQREAELLAQAKGMGEAPTAAGVSRVALPGVTAFLWESVKGHVCLGESVLSGGLRAVKCSETGEVKPKGDSKLAALFGPGTLNDGARVVMVADPGEKVVSIKYQKQKMDWKFVRTLTPATSGRAVYYVTLPDFPDDWLDVGVRVGGQAKADRLWLGW